ncbi:prepilin peptidase [Bradyrhizobium sp. INPA01-394B]|uniref:Prepilin peptidase n=1 Tax=Bradyrhizobium campsiandrae TaxID=1729892 RepID=A0ABR7UAQ4_9BRAD|nr:A24 family peptidase [Bradyrhizobium campsiandrae]MBC9882124.1 prepilin peptidase [Bradyrhizobium campsiandrae]MBC9981052.1 prepilin peptidase [Bradyrhizobium campsiandrae]
MIAELRKTAQRTGRFLANALLCREPYRDQVLVAWCLVVGLIWTFLNSAAEPEPQWLANVALAAGLFAVLAAICAIDARFGIIPDKLVVLMAVGGLAAVLLKEPDEGISRILEVVFVAAAIAAFRSTFRWLRGYDGLGFGDVKFIAAATFWIGVRSLPALLLIAVASALASAFLLRVQRYEVDGRHAIPFGPHLAVGLWLAWVFDPMSFVLG